MEKRGNFSNKIGFVLAAAGSAVGLGNIWRFPYLAAKYGGGTFLLVYLILAVTFGFSLMIAEIAIGRKTGLSAIGAFKALDKRFGAVGYLAAIIPIIIFPYYSVIGGWVIKYLVTFCSGGGMAAANDNYFGTFAAGTAEPLIYFFIFIAFTALVVWFGVEKGIEKVSKVMMPILVVLTIFIAIYGLTIDGAKDGLIYYIKPRLSDFTFKTVIAAMGQLFYSMSLAMGIMITYGSYMKKENNLESSVRQIEIFDTAIAFLAGLTIIPAVFAFSSGDKAALGKGPSLMFVTLPKVFDSMPFGSVIGTVFFVLVLFAALTSAISLMETIVSIFSDKLGWSRHKATLIVFICAVAIGVLPCLGFGVLDFIHIGAMTILDIMDFVSNSILMPICALFTCILIGFVVKPKAVIDEATRNGEKFKSRNLFVVVIKWVSPICLVLILISSILDALGIFTI
ncbi:MULTISPECIES: sodium-dependent transporter [unclassified Eubacterium (in: firmicutes)]|uniref:sodium-dependent transporter n=1 Tax=unclassified Eubacterium (in: firmicutes) TaxID=2624479 RepID=UPI000E48F8B2|nr:MULTISPECIES: sodium-dependent transporter [unclassified Eubacterium (in: firmicutes)]RGF52939.1 sodium-dependent transporter [Eubacterium sp. AF36-5BH]RHP22781.1 sodium-dependent transporter [Eubacterium sp. AF34-35BH]